VLALAATAYLLVFLIVLAFVASGPAPIRETTWQRVAWVEAGGFTGLVFAGAALGWPLFVRGWFARGRWASWAAQVRAAMKDRRRVP